MSENIKHASYHNGTIIGVINDKLTALNTKGELCEIPFPKFKHKQIVKTTKEYFSPKSFTRLLSPCYTESRGWVYGENYIDREGKTGGSGWSFDESGFLPLDDASDILLAKRIELVDRLNELKNETRSVTEELSKLRYAIDIVSPKNTTNEPTT